MRPNSPKEPHGHTVFSSKLDLTFPHVTSRHVARSRSRIPAHEPPTDPAHVHPIRLAGTLLVTCTRSGARAATSWPPRWARDSPKGGAWAARRRARRPPPPQQQPQQPQQPTTTTTTTTNPACTSSGRAPSRPFIRPPRARRRSGASRPTEVAPVTGRALDRRRLYRSRPPGLPPRPPRTGRRTSPW